MLLKVGADVNVQGGFYNNALYAAVSEGHKAVVSVLLKASADVNAQDGSYGNALLAAASQVNQAVFRLLSDHAADFNNQSRELEFWVMETRKMALGEEHPDILTNIPTSRLYSH